MLRVIEDIGEAEALWRDVVEVRYVCDEWVFREVFWRQYQYKLSFRVWEEEGRVVGLLPLQWNEERGGWQFFGGGWFEHNRVYVRPGFEWCVGKLYASVEAPYDLSSCDVQVEEGWEVEDMKYVLDVGVYSSVEEYLDDRVEKDRRKDMKRVLRKVGEVVRVEMVGWGREGELVGRGGLGGGEDLERLFELSVKRFGSESTFADERRETYRNLVRLDFDWRWLRFVIGDDVVGVALGLVWRDVWVYVNSGVDVERMAGLGGFVNMKVIEAAIDAESVRLFDAQQGDLGWKRRFGLEEVAQWRMR